MIYTKISKKDESAYSKYAMYGAVLAVSFSAVGWLGPDIWLASTQWLMVATILALFGLYLKTDSK